jgi:hypothetical protein
MAGKTRRRSVALTRGERDAGLRVAYLAHYGADPEFGLELTTLYVERAEPARPLPFDPAEWWIGAASDRADVRELWGVTPAVAAYVGAVRDLAGRYGLPGLQVPEDWLWGTLTVGEWLVHSWCSWRATMAGRERTVGPEWFALGYGLAEAQAAISVAPVVVARVVPPWRDLRPSVAEARAWARANAAIVEEAVAAGPFDPRQELYGDARTRLGWRHRAALEAIAEAAKSAGYVFELNPETSRDVEWLYRHVAKRETLRGIAAREFPSADAASAKELVRRAVRRISCRVLHPGGLTGR